MTVAVLFARADSVYKTLPGVDVWDEARDARQWPGSGPAVAHPPCRAWGRLRAFANPAPHEKDMARFAVAKVREFGGVLEIAGEPRRLIFQGVHKIAGFDYGREWGDEAPRSDIVLIGRSLPEAALRAGFAECVAG